MDSILLHCSRLLQHLLQLDSAFHSHWARICYAVLGLMQVAYLGYGIGSTQHFREPWEDKIILAQVVGLICYVPLVVVSLWMFW